MSGLRDAIFNGQRDSRYPPIFVVGCPRSGTTMLASLLEQTPWGWPFETHFLIKYYHRLSAYEPLNERSNMLRLAQTIMAERVGQQWMIDLDHDLDLENIVDGLAAPTYACLVDALCSHSPDRTAAESWGDKTPQYVLELDVIRALFPDSKIMLIVRDGRDVALSLLGRDWGPRNMATCAELWRQCHGPNELADELASRGQLIKLKYEHMLQDPKGELERVLDFLGVHERREEILAGVKAVDAANADKWRTQLSPNQLRVFESVAGETLSLHDYPRACQAARLSWLESLGYQIHEKLSLAWHLFRINIVDTVMIKFFGKQPFAD